MRVSHVALCQGVGESDADLGRIIRRERRTGKTGTPPDRHRGFHKHFYPGGQAEFDVGRQTSEQNSGANQSRGAASKFIVTRPTQVLR